MSSFKSVASSLNGQLSDLRSHYSENLTKDEALELAMEAAQLQLKFMKLATDKTERTDIRKKAVSLLDEAEKIKNSTSTNYEAGPLDLLIDIQPLQPTQPAGKKLEPPSSKRVVPTNEQVILLKASKLNGAKFPPWTEDPAQKDFEVAPGEELFCDPVNLSLSQAQLAIFDAWKRPKEALSSTGLNVDRDGISSQRIMDAGANADLVQDAASDCSVVASLAAVVARFGRGHARIMSSIIFPHDEETGRATLAPNGKHIVKLHFNGCPRKVVIDDRLPVCKPESNRKLYAVDRSDPALLWPAIVEKAYLKVRGGYNFPGSNSGTDLWVLTGWIPEHIFLDPEEIDTAKLWRRMLKAFEYGDVLVTVGTGKLTLRSEKVLGLAGDHDYAVLDLKEVGGKRMMLIKNPWLKATAWRGYKLPPFSHAVEDSTRADESESEDEDWKSATSQKSDKSSTLVSIDSVLQKDLKPGTFWMSFTDVIQHYQSIYLNFNPGLFRYRQDIHFEWDLSLKQFGSKDTSGLLYNNPQHGIFCEAGGDVWVIVSRHFRDKEKEEEARLAAPPTRGTRDGFISLSAFAGAATKIYMNQGSANRTIYVDSPQTLLRMEFPPRTPHTFVLSEQHLPLLIHTFTLSAFSNAPISLATAKPKYACSQTVRASWTSTTSGGPAGTPTYSQNPQFSINIPRASCIALLLETTTEALDIHVKLLHSDGRRVYTFTKRDMVVDSGDYRRGCVLAELTRKLDMGSYTIICSTFTKGETGEFSLTVDSDVAVVLKPTPREGAGRIRTQLADASFPSGIKAVAAPVTPHMMTRMNFCAKYVASMIRQNPTIQHSPLRLTVELGRGPNRQILIASASGMFIDASMGVRTEDVDVDRKMKERHDMWLVLERLGIGFEGFGSPEERVSVEVYQDAIEGVSFGVWREWDR